MINKNLEKLIKNVKISSLVRFCEFTTEECEKLQQAYIGDSRTRALTEKIELNAYATEESAKKINEILNEIDLEYKTKIIVEGWRPQ